MYTKINPGLDEATTAHFQHLADLRGLIWASIGSGQTFEQIAKDACIGASTVKRFAEGKTIRPTGLTVQQLAKVCGYRVAYVPGNTPKLPGELG